ncbi:hypothetical protein EVAR_84892_1 [Eumeta japonica]|uniref:Reverse transcriptase domain-containing protein n=1 Tax=Eumeta variegata TaxID=151549 RepID=A0A4C1YES7_EUMVA|nr:hypothetical protein EVAR_84892_1 [Eumeta japonica]
MDELSGKCLLYIDDKIILAQSACGLQKMINKMDSSLKKRGESMTELSSFVMVARPSTAMINKNIDALRRLIETDRHVTYHEINVSSDIGTSEILTIVHKHLASIAKWATPAAAINTGRYSSADHLLWQILSPPTLIHKLARPPFDQVLGRTTHATGEETDQVLGRTTHTTGIRNCLS